MIYALIVIYNKNIVLDWDKKEAKRHEKINFIIFDNSTDENIIRKNKEFCSENDILYRGGEGNIGLSKAYNSIIKEFIQPDDYLLILDDDSKIEYAYIEKCLKCDDLVYTPINIDKANNAVDSPRRVKKGFLLKSEKMKSQNESESNYVVSINNGLLIKGSVFQKIGLYNESLFLYFVDSLFFFNLYKERIPTRIIHYYNYCDFSFGQLEYKPLKNKLALMKKDGYVYFKQIYSELSKPNRAYIHYFLFFFKKSIECCKATSFIHFFSFLFCRRKREN